MGTGYVRNDTANNIANGNVINADDLDGEFNAIEATFNSSSGHTHDGTTSEGAPIEVIGPSQDVVATAALLRPKTTNTVDLGTDALRYKDLFMEGNADIDVTVNAEGVVTANAGVVIDNITIDGTEIDLSSGDLTVDVAGDIILDADGGDFKFQDGGTEILRITNSSSDVIIKPIVDAKDIIFQQRDGTEVARIEDNGTFNVVTDKLAINSTAVTATAEKLNFTSDVTSAIQAQLDAKAGTSGPTFTGTLTAPTINASTALQIGGVAITSDSGELNLLDGSAAGTIANSKAVIYGSSGEVNATTLQIAGTSITSTPEELNILDGVTATAAELNYNDITTLGLTEASKVVTADANGVVSFDNGTTEESTVVSSSSNAATINLRDGNVFTHTLSENVTYTFSNPAASGRASAFILKVVQDSSARTITWPGTVDWAAATAPTITATNAGVDVFAFITVDGGTNYYGFTLGQAMG